MKNDDLVLRRYPEVGDRPNSDPVITCDVWQTLKDSYPEMKTINDEWVTVTFACSNGKANITKP